MAPSQIDYPRLLQRALRSVVREVLDGAAREGLPGEHHFYLSVRTDYPGTEVPAFLRQRYPEELTVVLQHQFWDLTVDDAGFAITLQFDGLPADLVIPWDAVVAFFDPTAEFGLRFDLPGLAGTAGTGGPRPAALPDVAGEQAAPADLAGGTSPIAAEAAKPPATAGEEPESAPGKVLSFGRPRARGDDEPQ